MDVYKILNDDDPTAKPLQWSNADGWVSDGDVFSDDEFHNVDLPDGGRWERLDQQAAIDYWHRQLTHDRETGEPTGHLHAPCSRYGRDGDDCAWWAIACQLIFEHANGQEGDTYDSLDYYMGLAVNDSDSVASLVYDYWYTLPRSLKQHLGTKRDVQKLVS